MTGKAVKKICIRAFIWRPTGGGLLNLPKPAQNLYFVGDSFQKLKKSATEYSVGPLPLSCVNCTHLLSLSIVN
jgi:hypothetical protein